MRLRGRVGIVTGAGRGIGREIADALAADGMSLMLLARTGAEVRAVGEHLAEQYDVRCLPAAIDVTDTDAVARVVQHAEQHLGPVDLLVNNAAVIERDEAPFWQADLEDLWRVVETNLRGPLVMTRELLPAMIARGRGHVVNITSRARAASETGTYTGYALSKRGLSVFTESLGATLRGTGVIVVDVLPGLVRTSMTEAMPVWRNVTEWDDAGATARLVADIAAGHYDDRSGEVLDAVQIDGDHQR